MHFVISERMAKKYKINDDDLGDIIVDYVGYEEIKEEFCRRGLPDYTMEQMEAIRKYIWRNHDNYDVPKLIDYLKREGVI
ncbi:MAG: hypothetical protein ACRCZ9_10335 [Fusobacteriaceae bacterium]